MKTSSALAAALVLVSAAASAAPPQIGGKAPDFTLPSAEGGGAVALKDLLVTHKAVAVIFVATQCPVSNAYNERMAALGKEYAAKGIAVVGINSNKTEPATEVAAHAKAHGFTFPVVKDDANRVADAYGATHTPEVFVISPRGDLLYHGRIDESQDDPKNVKSPDLRNALEAILAGRPVPAPETRAFGCSIKRV